MTTFMGQELHSPRPGNVWTMQIFPGGRKVIVQAKPYRISNIESALTKLANGHRVYVALTDAVAVLQRAQQPLQGGP